MFSFLMKCNICSGKGTIEGIGGMSQECDVCKCKRKFAAMITGIITWLLGNPFKTTPVGMALSFFAITLLIHFLHPIESTFGILVGSFGAIFIALKYKLDQTSYHKSLFEERYAILLKIDEILSASLEGKSDWRFLKEELDSIYRKSYFLFGEKTYNFIDNFRSAVSSLSLLHDRQTPHDKSIEEEVNKAKEFLQKLLDRQNLSEKFPELKIDFY